MLVAFLVVFCGDLSAREASHALHKDDNLVGSVVEPNNEECLVHREAKFGDPHLASAARSLLSDGLAGLAKQATPTQSSKGIAFMTIAKDVETLDPKILRQLQETKRRLQDSMSSDYVATNSTTGADGVDSATGGIADIEKDSKAMTTAVCGSGQLVSFPANVPKTVKNNVLNCLLFAQQVANKKYPNGNNDGNVTNWYYEYTKFLEQVCQFELSASAAVDFSSSGKTVSISKVFLQIVASLAEGAAGGGANWKGALNTAYKALNASSGNLKIFQSEMSKFKFNTIQQILVTWNANSSLPHLTMASLSVNAKSLSDDVLFVEYSSDEITVKQRDFSGTQNYAIFTHQDGSKQSVADILQEKLEKKAMASLESFLDDDDALRL